MDATAKICFGFIVKDDYNLPWNKKEYDGHIDDWWLEGVLGFDKDFYDYYDTERRERIEPAYTEEYYEPRKKLKENNPLPIEIEYFGHANGATRDVIIVPDSCMWLQWGPKPFDFTDEINLDKLGKYKEFCLEYIPDEFEQPKWLWGSYYG